MRSIADYSIGDFMSWTVFLLAAFAISILAGLAFDRSLLGISDYAEVSRSLLDDDIPEQVGFLSAACFLQGIALLFVSIVELFVLKRKLGRRFHRKDAVLLLGQGSFRKLRSFRNVVAIIGGFVVQFPISPTFQSANVFWISLNAVLGLAAIAALVSQLKFGDATYAAGFLVVAVSAFVPPASSDGLSALGFLQLIVAAFMAMGWLYRIERHWLAILALLGGLPFLIGMSGSSQNVLNIFIGGIAAIFSLVATVNGCGNQLEDNQEYRLTVLPQLTSSQHRTSDVKLN